MTAPRASMRTRLVAIALVAILPAAVLMFWAQSSERQAARDRSLADNLRLVRSAGKQVQDVFEGALRLHATLKRFPTLTDDAADCSAILGRVKNDHPGYVNIGIFNADGSPFCTAAPIDPRVFQTARDRAWFTRALTRHGFSLGDYQRQQVSGRAVFVVAEPIGGTGREPLRVLASSLSVETFGRVLGQAEAPRGGTLTLFDASHTILARVPDGRSAVGTRVPDPPDVRTLTSASEIVQRVRVGGANWMAVTVPVETLAGQPLYLTCSISDEIVFAGADTMFRHYVWLLLAVAVVSLTTASALGQFSVLRPMNALTTSNARTTRELLASEERYRELFAHHPHPMWVFDRQTLEFLEVNDAAVRRYGYSRQEFLTMRITEIRPPEDAEMIVALVHAQANVEWARTDAWRHRLKSGELIPVEVTSHAFSYLGRDAFLVVAIDVTDRKRAEAQRAAAEQALRVTEERLRFATEAAGVGVWECNLLTGDSYWSETCERIHGLAPGSFGGTHDAFLACIREEDRAGVRNAIEDAIRDKHNVEFEYEAAMPAAAGRRIAVIGTFTYDEHGQATRGAGISVDVTEKRSLEHQLRQSQKMEAVGQLAGGVAHDFNNLLTAILGYSHLVHDSFDAEDPRRADLQEIQHASRRAAELTQRLLAFSRKQILSPRVLHVGDAIGQLAPMLRRLLGESIELRTIVQNRRHIKVDQTQLDQVLLNLAVNARDAMDQRGILTIETADVRLDEHFVREHGSVMTAGPYVMIAVTDTGCGMDQETQCHIFEPFFTTKPKDRGTGLGLAMVYGTVKQSGGSIWVYSEVGKGTTFKLYLPSTPQDASDAVADMPCDEALVGGAESILVVEDEAQVREYTARALRNLGYAVTAIEHPADAIAYARDHRERIDLVVTDVVMPTFSGPDMYAEIRASHPESAVLLMSGYADEAIVSHNSLTVNVPFLQKPFTSAVLAHRVRETLSAAART